MDCRWFWVCCWSACLPGSYVDSPVILPVRMPDYILPLYLPCRSAFYNTGAHIITTPYLYTTSNPMRMPACHTTLPALPSFVVTFGLVLTMVLGLVGLVLLGLIWLCVSFGSLIALCSFAVYCLPLYRACATCALATLRICRALFYLPMPCNTRNSYLTAYLPYHTILTTFCLYYLHTCIPTYHRYAAATHVLLYLFPLPCIHSDFPAYHSRAAHFPTTLAIYHITLCYIPLYILPTIPPAATIMHTYLPAFPYLPPFIQRTIYY